MLPAFTLYFGITFSFLNTLKYKYRCSIRRKIQRYAVIPVITVFCLCHDFLGNRLSGSSKPLFRTAQKQLIFFLCGNSQLIIFPFDRRHVNDEHKVVFTGGIPSVKAVCASVLVITVQPFKALPAVIELIQAGILMIQLQQFLHIFMKSLIQILLQQEPVKLSFL